MRWMISLSMGISVMMIMSCGDSGRGQNRTIKEAATIHNKMMTRHDSIFTALKKEKERINQQLESGISNKDKKSAYESMIRSIDKSFRILGSWEESVVTVPGTEHKHGENCNHDHDHHKEDLAKNLSDKELLQLQEALQERLEEVATQIKGLLTTIEMYDQNG